MPVPHSFLTGDSAVTAKPNIVISELDAERLDALLKKLPQDAFPGKAALEAELERAEVVRPEDMPPDVVTMNSTVRFNVTGSTEEFCLTLVYPGDIDSSGTKISILAPVGSALLGLSEGDEIEWPRPGGGTMSVRIIGLEYQPEREGALHR
jgi:regulator of nucleoside diphosphate kinase